MPRLIFQNGGYDVQWLYEVLGCKVYGWTDDTRLLHHAIYPELQKGLEFMTSLYCDTLSNHKLLSRGEKKEE